MRGQDQASRAAIVRTETAGRQQLDARGGIMAGGNVQRHAASGLQGRGTGMGGGLAHMPATVPGGC